MHKVEFILCAAIWYKDLPTPKSQLPTNIVSGIVVCGRNHAQCLHVTNALTGKKMSEQGLHIQGFLTSVNRFVDRIEAMKIATDNNQVLCKHGGDDILYSEDLLYY